MTAGEEETPGRMDDTLPSQRARRRWLRMLVVALVLLAVVLVVWSQRRPIASGFVGRELERRGVAARYRIADLGFDRQRLTDVSIGDPANPDLVADWVELSTSVGFDGARVRAIRAGQVRLRGRLVNGRVSFGAIDRLLPPPSGKPFSLPDIRLDVTDGRLRLNTPNGIVGFKLDGRGRLTDGFAGKLAAVSDRLDMGSCTLDGVTGFMGFTIADGRPRFDGPLRIAGARCGDGRIERARIDLDATLGEALDRWSGRAGVAADRGSFGANRLAALSGTIAFAGGPRRTEGIVDLAARDFTTSEVSGRCLRVAGDYRLGGDGAKFTGTATAGEAALAARTRAVLAGIARGGAGTPVAPLLAALGGALDRAGRGMSLSADLELDQAEAGGQLLVERLEARSRSGVRALLGGGEGISYRWPDGGVRLDGLLTLSGGGLPSSAIRLAQRAPGAPVTGTAVIAPYAAGGARLALTAVDFSATPGGNTRFSTRATLSGPLGDGRVEALSLPIAGVWNGAARLVVNPGCAPLSFDRLAISGLALARSQLWLCPTRGALLTVNGSRLAGGARVAAPRLAGRLGGTPITLAAAGSDIAFDTNGFTLGDVAVRLGEGDRISRLDFARLDGRISGSSVAGRFSGGSGQIAAVPLLMSQAAGTWRLDGGRLAVDGDLEVADADANPRFNPLTGTGFTLTLANSRVDARGTLAQPATGTRITDVAITHNLSVGAGRAVLDVPGITFGSTLQPEELTRLTLGVVANVRGSVSGRGEIRWDRERVTSDGVFRTTDTDLAAAFGPVDNLSGEVRFTDLLGLVSAPGQVATLGEVNPGIAVQNGSISYRLLADQKVQIEGGRWPFSGGELLLDPTVLDFGQAAERRMTFRVVGMDSALFVQQFDFDNIAVTGIFDGVMPIFFDANGGRIEAGRLVVRQGGGTLAYVGEVSNKDLGLFGSLAFDALKSMRYRNLAIELDGDLDGELISRVLFDGTNETPPEAIKRNGLLRQFSNLPFRFRITIRAPFRGLLNSAQALNDPRGLISQALPPDPTPLPGSSPVQPR